MKKWLAILGFALPMACLTPTRAQDYNTAIGVNIGSDMGFGFKHFLGERSAIEAQFGYNVICDGVMLSAVYQYHIPLAQGLNFYAGGGLNIGALHLGKTHPKADFAIGIDPTIGFEYKFDSAPIALALDYKPNINFTVHSQWSIAELKVRYTF